MTRGQMAKARQQIWLLFIPETQPQNLFNVTHQKTQNQCQRTAMERTERTLKSSEVIRNYEFSNTEPQTEFFYLKDAG